MTACCRSCCPAAPGATAMGSVARVILWGPSTCKWLGLV